MITFLQLQTIVFDRLKDESSGDGFWSKAEVKNAINNAYMHIADETLCFKLDMIIEIRANIRRYKLPYDYIIGSLYRVEFDSKKIDPISSSELDATRPSWRQSSSDNVQNYLEPGDLCNSDEIIVFPKPTVTGSSYALASATEDLGVITDIGDDSYPAFDQEEGVIVSTDGDARFDETEGSGPVVEIEDPDGNLTIFGSRYPKRLFNDNEAFLHPLTFNPRDVLTHGALSELLSKDGEGKDIQKSSFHYKRFMEKMQIFKSQKSKRFHRRRSISEYSIDSSNTRGANLGEHYPSYIR